jgi:hypothetical protein
MHQRWRFNLLVKKQNSLKYVYKIHTSRLREANWNLELSRAQAKKSKEIISLGDSQIIRFINKINGHENIEQEIKNTKAEIKRIKELKNSKETKDEIKIQYDTLDNLLFVEDYVCLIIDNNKDYDRANKGFTINNIKYLRLLGTNGGVKNSTIVYVSEKVKPILDIKVENGRNKDDELVAGKFEAYKSLVCSASYPASSLDPDELLVIHDCITNFKANVITIDDTTDAKYPIMKHEKDYGVELIDSDGYGLISYEQSKKYSEELGLGYTASGYNIRFSFTKGMIFTFDFHKFAEKVAEKNVVIDAWGHPRDINKVKIILTTSMVKLWKSYTNVEHFLKCCKDNGYELSINKVTPKKLEDERYLNYQFIQSLALNDEKIEELIMPTVTEIKEVLGGDYKKSLLFLKGIHLSDETFLKNENDFVKALMIDENMINDPFVRTKIHNMIKKRINDSKTGVLKVSSNWSIVSGDPYSLCQSMFKMEVTGLLRKGQFYNKYFNDKNIPKVAAFRAPMTCHNNIRILRFENTDEMKDWYKYMPTVTIFNSWDTTAHALNGLDKDSDSILCTDNSTILQSVDELDAIICKQKTADKKVITEFDLIKSNKDSFGDEIGSITNRITTMFDVQSRFDKDSDEYKELDYRIKCGQNYQQNAIDKVKGIKFKPMPREWHSFSDNVIVEEDYIKIKKTKKGNVEVLIKADSEEVKAKKRFNMKILVNKKPYYFNYIYEDKMKAYSLFVEQLEKNSLRNFSLTIDELRQKTNKSEEEIEFLDYYDTRLPSFRNESVMNKICWRIEEEFYRKVSQKAKLTKFDYSILKSDIRYTKEIYTQIKELYEEYKVVVANYEQSSRKKRIKKEEKIIQCNIFKEIFKRYAAEICPNAEELCNVIVDVCYKGNSSKQFAWDNFGNEMITNLLRRNNNTVKYIVLDKNGDIEFGGKKYKMREKKIQEGEEIDEDSFE